MTSRDPYRAQRVGNLRERVLLQSVTYTDDGYGGSVPEWHDLAEVWARVEPVKSDERVIAGGIANVNDVLVHIRHRDDLDTTGRVTWAGRDYNIKGIRNLDERRQYLTLDCQASI